MWTMQNSNEVAYLSSANNYLWTKWSNADDKYATSLVFIPPYTYQGCPFWTQISAAFFWSSWVCEINMQRLCFTWQYLMSCSNIWLKSKSQWLKSQTISKLLTHMPIFNPQKPALNSLPPWQLKKLPKIFKDFFTSS